VWFGNKLSIIERQQQVRLLLMDSILGKAKPAFKLSDPSAMFEVVKHKKKTLGNSQTAQTFN